MADAALQIGDSQMRRMDLVALRKRIQNALGPEKWHKYWITLQRFTRCKLSKEELDTDARAVLGNDNVALHNQLIRGILQNAIINTVHPPAVEIHTAPEPFDLPPARPEKKKKKKPEVVAAGVAGRDAKGAGVKRDSADKFSHDIMWLQQQESLRRQWTICDGADFYDESLELPSFFRLRHTIRKRCRDFALDVPQETVEYMQKAMEEYLKTVALELQRAAAMRRTVSGPASPTSSEWPTITYADFEAAQEFAPRSLQLSSVLNLERRSLLQHQEW